MVSQVAERPNCNKKLLFLLYKIAGLRNVENIERQEAILKLICYVKNVCVRAFIFINLILFHHNIHSAKLDMLITKIKIKEN